MKVNYRSVNGRLTFEIAGETQTALFKGVSEIQEVFEAEANCGCCKSDDLRFRAREVDSYKFFELNCRGCGARFSFGQHKNGGTLFPKRNDDDGNPLPNGGWEKYQKPNGAPQPAARYDPPPSGPPPVRPRTASR